MKKVIILTSILLTLLQCKGADLDPAGTIDNLIPTLSSANVPDRYGAQMELQKLAVNAARPGAEAERLAMANAIAKKAKDKTIPQPARVWLVRMLEYIGRDESVNALTDIMKENDTESRECARRALEKNPSKSAIASLRSVLKTEKDTTMQIGLINSLGERADADSVALISKYLDNPKTASTAAMALGKIANESAIESLFRVYNKLPAAGEALIEAAKNNNNLAKNIYTRVYEKGTFAPVRGAALVGLAKIDPNGAYNIIADALTGNDEKLQHSAVVAMVEGNFSSKLMTLFPKTSLQTKFHILSVVDKSAELQVIDVLKDSDQNLRVAAINALGRIGGVASVPVLIQVAAGDSQAEKSAAENALASIPGIDSAIENVALNGDVKNRVVAINTIASRRQVASLPILAKLTDDKNDEIKKATYKSLGKLGGDKEFEIIAKSGGKSKDAINTLETIAPRLTNKSAAANTIISLIGNDKTALTEFINVLVALGTDECLKPIAELAKSEDANSKQVALKALSEWQNLSAVQYLLPVVIDNNTPQNQYNIALKGITQIIKSSDGADVKAKADALLTIYNSARTDGDKKLIISAMATVPEPRIANTLKSLLTDQKFKQEAAQAAISVAESMSKTDKNTAKDLAAAIKGANINDDLNKRASKIK